ncbi:ABC-2 transporter permease [Brevibacterium sp. JNUCC-42]|nr:ABC-2 transporter permease [Brevibacterium sp. JNUCC-42]
MVHLWHKDMYLLFRKNWLIILLGTWLLQGFTFRDPFDSLMMGVFVSGWAFYFIELPEKREKQQTLLVSLPVSRQDLVKSKYLFLLTYAGMWVIITTLLNLVHVYNPFSRVTQFITILDLLSLFCMITLLGAVHFLLQLTKHFTKVGGLMPLAIILLNTNSFLTNIRSNVGVFTSFYVTIFAGISLVLVIISYLIHLKVYSKRDFI